ncbi:MAG: prolyl oligopeptidase family serine peptidase [Bacteroidetes bacterium]|nr:prolyl oligopeptidase family serine peptidase [Bacteroidota bacterium]
MRKSFIYTTPIFVFTFIIALFSCKNETIDNTSIKYNYPKTKTVDSSDTYFGVTYKDPYRWLENLKDTNVISWCKDQADFSKSILENITGRDELIAEWKMLDSLQPPRINRRNIKNGRVFYNKTMPKENVAKVYYKEGIDGKEILLFDPTIYIKDKTLSVQASIPSYDGKKIMIAYSENGAETSTIKIMDVDTKTFLPETIYPTSVEIQPNWSFDNKSILYVWLQSDDNSDEEMTLNPKTKLHVLGSDVKKDIDFFSNGSYPQLGIKPNEMPTVSLRQSSPNFIFASLDNARQEMLMYYAPISQFNSSKKEWSALCKPSDQLVKGIEFIDNKVYAITSKNAKNYKLICTNLQKPDWDHAITIAEEKKASLEAITYSKDFIFLTYNDGINYQLYKYNLNTETLSEVKLPHKGILGISCIDKSTNECLLAMASYNKQATEFFYNPITDSFSPSTYNKPPNYPKAYGELVVEEVEVKGHDGVMIPLTIIYKNGTKKDGNNVCLMNGYGSYGMSWDASYYDDLENTLAIKGAVIAIAHVRGGGEKGEAWYKAGFKTTKPNTWKDFNSCAEYLISKGYTSSSKLACYGASAGGLLISRAITERPDLYAAAIVNVGTANKMRDEFSPGGNEAIPEYGTVNDSIECKALYEMDGLQHVVKGTKYPAVICVAGWNDPRVIAWQPGKFSAALQNASSSNKPILMKVNYDNGHETEDQSVTFANFADQFAFVMWQCGHPEFTLKK